MTTKRKRGRPPLDPTDPSDSVSVSLPSKRLNDLCVVAIRLHVSAPEIIRRLLPDESVPEILRRLQSRD